MSLKVGVTEQKEFHPYEEIDGVFRSTFHDPKRANPYEGEYSIPNDIM